MASVAKREWTSPKGEQKSGWEVRYKEGGKHRSRTFRLFKEANAFKQRVERELHDGTHTALTETVTVRQAAEEFIRESEERERDGRLGKSRQILITRTVRKHVVSTIGDVLFSKLSWQDVERLHRAIVQTGVTPLTARQYTDALRQIEEFAIRRGYTKKVVVAQFVRQLRGISRPKVRTFSTIEVRQVLDCADVFRKGRRKDIFDLTRCFLNIATYCGLRFGEIAGLTLSSLDFERGLIRVRHNLTAHGELKGPKTRAGLRDVEMPDHVAAMISHFIEEHHLNNDCNLIFVTRLRTPLTSPQFYMNM